jgi:Phosphotyrosine interaction domain (PTB/PID)
MQQCFISVLPVLIEGVLFRARYLGSTQLISEGQPSKAVRMLQAQEAINRIKVCDIIHWDYRMKLPQIVIGWCNSRG